MTTEPSLKAQKKLFAKKFKAVRIAAGISQIKLAKMTGISNSTLSNYEVGKTLPNEENAKKLAKALPALETPTLGPGLKKTSIIEAAVVHPEGAKAAFMRMLLDAAPEMKASMNNIMAQAKKANISQTEAFGMLGVLLEK